EELKLFMQLQTVEAEEGAPRLRPEGEEPEAAPAGVPAAVPPEARGGIRRFLSPSWLAAGVVVLVLVALAGLRLAGVNISWGSRDERAELLNRGRALIVVGDYDGAIQVFEQLLTISPGNQEAQAELERAQRLKTLAELYAQAKEHIAAQEWEEAAAVLEQVLALDANYRDAATLAAEVERQRRLAALYEEAKALYDQGNWVDAAAKFEELRALDATYRSDVVEEYLFVCHLNQGLSLIVTSGDSVDRIKEAIRQFGAALSIHPRNKQAAEEQRLANLYLGGYTSYQRQEWNQAILKIQQVLDARPDYAGGRAAQILCASYVALGDQARERNDLLTALEHYRKALAREDLQCPPAQEREQEILLTL
ncbi:MAG: tetratricopeptide repeat protein, partial [Anaerolineae bacterium]|nr:tetratricopeptide repeat protein [Anaerolineae bacterium]